MSAPKSAVIFTVSYDDDLDAGADALLAVLRPATRYVESDTNVPRDPHDEETTAEDPAAA